MNQKIKKYAAVSDVLDALIGSRDSKYILDKVAKMALISWALMHNSPHFIFSGFYIVSRHKVLTIGPYQGDVMACCTIPFGKGVCGIVAEKKKSLIVGRC